MKTKLLFFLLLVQFAGFSQSGWLPMGDDDFNRATLDKCYAAGRNSIIAKNGSIFFFNNEFSTNNTRFSVNKYSNNHWEHVTFPFLFPGNTPKLMDCAVDNNEIPYVFFNGETGSGLPIVRKFENGVWTDVGSGISALTSPVLDLQIGTDNLPRVLFREGNIVKLKRFDGSNWVVISETTEFIPYSSISLELDNNNVPYAVSNHNTSGSNYIAFVKKFNGSGWEEVGITGFTSPIVSLVFDNTNTPHISLSNTIKKFNGSTWDNISTPLTGNLYYPYISSVGRLSFNSNNELFARYVCRSVNAGSTHLMKTLVNGVWQTLADGNIFMEDSDFAASGNSAYLVRWGGNPIPKIYKYTVGQPDTVLGNYTYVSYGMHDFSICNDIPTVAYKGGNKAAVRMYLNNSWSGWVSTQISESDVLNVMIKSGTNGKIYLAYNNKMSSSSISTDTRMTVKELSNTGSWQPVGGVNFSQPSGAQFDFKLSHNNEPYVLYMSGRVQKFDGTNWVFVGGSAYNGDVASRLALDVNDVPYIAFIDPSNSNQIAVKRLNGNTWEYVDPAGLPTDIWPRSQPKILIDPMNTIYLGYTDNLGRVHVKKLNNGNWQSVGPELLTMQNTNSYEIAVDQNNVFFLVYSELENNFNSRVSVKKFNGTDWEFVGQPNFTAGSAWGKIAFWFLNTPLVTYGSQASGQTSSIDTRYFDADTLGNNASQQENQNWIVTPNPVSSTFSINRSDEIQLLEIYDLTGKKMQIETSNFTNIDISALSSGLYIIKVKAESGTGTVKLLKK